MSKTRWGVYHDLYNSEYTTELCDMILVFSSLTHQLKFINTYQTDIISISKSLSKRFKININAGILALILCYHKIESRGFLIKYKGVDYKCLDHLILAIKID